MIRRRSSLFVCLSTAWMLTMGCTAQTSETTTTPEAPPATEVAKTETAAPAPATQKAQNSEFKPLQAGTDSTPEQKARFKKVEGNALRAVVSRSKAKK